MKTIKTASGKTFEILWDGVATIDGALRFAVVNASMPEILATFMDPTETATLTRAWDEEEVSATYAGFTRFRGIDRKPDEEVIVALELEG